jgi:hypothetical protein
MVPKNPNSNIELLGAPFLKKQRVNTQKKNNKTMFDKRNYK